MVKSHSSFFLHKMFTPLFHRCKHLCKLFIDLRQKTQYNSSNMEECYYANNKSYSGRNNKTQKRA